MFHMVLVCMLHALYVSYVSYDGDDGVVLGAMWLMYLPRTLGHPIESKRYPLACKEETISSTSFNTVRKIGGTYMNEASKSTQSL